MTRPEGISNVYYLPVTASHALAAMEPVARPRWQVVVADILWRVRFIVAEIRHIVSVPVPPVGREAAFLTRGAELAAPPPLPSLGPARIIDFAAARSRIVGGGLCPPSDGRRAPDGALRPASPQDR